MMRVALMITCVNDALFPDTGKAVVALLRRLGVDVEFPFAQTCCAQPMVNTGYLDEAVPVVRRFVEAFAGYDAGDTVRVVRRVRAPPAPHRRSPEPRPGPVSRRG
jgi:Fe-S oxidoreductase